MSDRLRIQAARRQGEFTLDLDLDLPAQGLAAVFGPSGAGKSTLINLLAGLLAPDRGRIALGDAVFVDRAAAVFVPAERRAVGVVFQDARLFPHLSVESNLRFGLRRARGRPARVDFAHVVELLGIGALLARRPHTLSGGEKQRVALGRALLTQPRLLLMDEPLASLDAPRKAEILPYIERLRDELALPIVYVSHALDEVLRLAATLVVLDGGRAVAAGGIDEVLQMPAVTHLFPVAEVGSMVHCTVRAHDDGFGLTMLAAPGFVLRVPRLVHRPGTPVRVRLPARDIALALSEPHDVSINNRIAATVVQIEPLDPTYADVQVIAGDGVRLRARITREGVARLALAPGMRVWCLIKSVALDRESLAAAAERLERT
jgi:molybdate transport system ATP-binding protein